MKLNGLLYILPKELKLLMAVFVLIINIGYFSALMMVENTTSMSSTGIQENYLGNEADENAVEMKFQKSESQVLGIIHSHILSMSMIFLLMGIFISLTKMSQKIKLFLMLEPFVSIIITFGGIYFLWKGITWFKYIIIFSGSLMTLTLLVSSLIIYYQLLFSKSFSNPKN
ncbi:MAG: hypothetical protein Q7U08_04390 [Flavobacteriaceae bacterium]|jgi:hypothetical protein|nr:hypothetical protein [Flavobacteriaceae bacterium]